MLKRSSNGPSILEFRHASLYPTSTDPPYAPMGLTYKIWEYVLIGINQLRLAYPGLNFRFEIYVNDCVGCGNLESGLLIHRPTTPIGDTVQFT